MSLTTLQLAEAIAVAVIREHLGYIEDPEDATVLAVFATLRENHAWFCTYRPDDNGSIIDESVRQMEFWE